LVFERGGAVVPLFAGSPVAAGRAPDAPIRLPPEDIAASRYHALFEASYAGVCVTDLQSRNGVHVNGQRVHVAVVSDGDRVVLGNTTVRVRREVRVSAEAAPRSEVTSGFEVPAWGVSTVKAKPYVCELCGTRGPVPAVDHEPWWAEVAWICNACAAPRFTPEDSWPIPIPRQIGEFEIVRFLDRGGMAAVFEGRHARAGIRAAVKLLAPESHLDPSRVKRFVKEQRILGGIHHERIVRSLGVGAQERWLFVAMELLSAGEASALAGPRSDVALVVALAADMFEALAHAHATGVIHRDVKPSNLLLVREGTRLRAKLSDFGLAKNLRDVGGSFLTRSREVGGSAAFVAPEQLTGFKRVGPSADVYSGGVTLYHLLTGALPVVIPCAFEDATDPQLCLATLASERTPVLALRPDLHPHLAQWIDLLVQRDETVRGHLDALTVASALRAYLRAP
jgi:hypothetical protein